MSLIYILEFISAFAIVLFNHMYVGRIFVYILILLIYVHVFLYLKKYIFDASVSIYEKILFILLYFIFIIPAILYILDSYNIPTSLGFFNIVPHDRWVDFIFDYACAIAGCVVSGLILLIVTIMQIKSHREGENENRRIANLPLLVYNFTINNSSNIKNVVDLCNSHSVESIYIDLEAKNLGMNTVRACHIITTSDNMADNYKTVDFGLINKGSFEHIVYRLPIESNGSSLCLSVIYQDLLFNYYEQKITLTLKNISYFKTKGYSADIEKVVSEEKVKSKISM